MKILIALILSTLPFASFVQAFEIKTKIGGSASIMSGVSNYTATGTVKTRTTSERGIASLDANGLTLGYVAKNSLEVLTVKQNGTTYSNGASGTLYAGISHGNIEIGGSVSAGGETSVSHSYDKSYIDTNGTETTETWLLSGPNSGHYKEVVTTDTRVQMDNYAKVETEGSWLATAKYIK